MANNPDNTGSGELKEAREEITRLRSLLDTSRKESETLKEQLALISKASHTHEGTANYSSESNSEDSYDEVTVLNDQISGLNDQLTTLQKILKGERQKNNLDILSFYQKAKAELTMLRIFRETLFFMSYASYCPSLKQPEGKGVDVRTMTLIKHALYPPSLDFRDALISNMHDSFCRSSKSVEGMIYWIKQAYKIWSTYTKDLGIDTSMDLNIDQSPDTSTDNTGETVEVDDTSKFAFSLRALMMKMFKVLTSYAWTELRPKLFYSFFPDDVSDMLSDRNQPSTAVNANNNINNTNNINNNTSNSNSSKNNIDGSKITKRLQRYFDMFKKYFVSDYIVNPFFGKLYKWAEVQVFNHLLEHVSSYCTAERGLQMKVVLSNMEEWRCTTLRIPNEELTLIREAASVMVVDKKLFADESVVVEIYDTLFSSLSYAQLYHLLSHFQPSHMELNAVPPSALKLIKLLDARSRNTTTPTTTKTTKT
eukprot:TRINITY_DN9580_c0_g1_i2.p1 TRINITY_DN9580_c0_g1~~TRINITY_DN9580_c0_g1_i2.p1  ORF type:complete len:480 (-),score=75.10 TRINITY_DN9580_c0_g1_i2:58-1497(-)